GRACPGFTRSFTTKISRRCLLVPRRLETFASAIPGPGSFRPSGETAIALCGRITRSTAKVPRAKIGVTGLTLQATAHYWPKTVQTVPDMPKTRSGKIMRRVLAAISNRMDTGDITTLANSDIVEQIRELVQGRAVLPLQEGPEDIKRFGQEPYKRRPRRRIACLKPCGSSWGVRKNTRRVATWTERIIRPCRV